MRPNYPLQQCNSVLIRFGSIFGAKLALLIYIENTNTTPLSQHLFNEYIMARPENTNLFLLE